MHVHCKCDSDGSMDGLPRISNNKTANFIHQITHLDTKSLRRCKFISPVKYWHYFLRE